ncbi:MULTISPECIES: MlaD family protein [unclassified Nocardioides]|uniref:MlaD family protein n=1 Tax=unclassified Nocardioides TaxID=2615069 RepID=UPI003613452D
MDFARTRRRVRLAEVLLLVIVVGGTAYVADTIVGGHAFSDTWRVTVDLRQAAGLHERSTVNYRGQRIGAVSDVHLTDEGVAATLEIDEGVRVPRDSDFEVRNLSAVGEQYLDIRPRVDGGPWLADGDHVPASETTTPLAVHEIVGRTQRLVDDIDLDDLRTIARETDAVFGDGSVDLRATSRELERTVGLLRDLQPDIDTLLTRGEVPLRTVRDEAPALRSSARDLVLVTRALGDATPEIRRLLRQGGELTPRLSAMLDDLGPALASLLSTSEPLSTMSADHLHGLDVWLDWIPAQLEGMAGSTRDGSGRVVLVPKLLDNCIYTQDQRDPVDTSHRDPATDRHCTSDDPGVQQRGSQNVPRP